MNSVGARRNEPSPNKISFDRHSRMVKKLDLLESNHGCELNALLVKSIRKPNVTQPYTVQNRRVTFSRSRSARGDITHDFTTFEYFDHTGSGWPLPECPASTALLKTVSQQSLPFGGFALLEQFVQIPRCSHLFWMVYRATRSTL